MLHIAISTVTSNLCSIAELVQLKSVLEPHFKVWRRMVSAIPQFGRALEGLTSCFGKYPSEITKEKVLSYGVLWDCDPVLRKKGKLRSNLTAPVHTPIAYLGVDTNICPPLVSTPTISGRSSLDLWAGESMPSRILSETCAPCDMYIQAGHLPHRCGAKRPEHHQLSCPSYI
jgi:hypothetical protein